MSRHRTHGRLRAAGPSVMVSFRRWLLCAPLVLAAFPETQAIAHGATTPKNGQPRTTSASSAHLAAPRARPAAPTRPALPKAIPASRAWHTVPSGLAASVDDEGRPMLTLRALNMPESVTLRASGQRGGFSAEDLDRAAHLLRDPRTGDEHPVDPHVLDLVYRVATHFSAPEVRIVSGYRRPRPGSRSNHGNGRAIDFVVPGTTDEDVATFAREQGFVGVGVYPTSGFVHLDVRERSYFWVDTSGPGKRNRTRGILPSLAARSDAQALARGDRSVGPFLLATDVDAALATRRGSESVPADAPLDDDDTDDVGAEP